MIKSVGWWQVEQGNRGILRLLANARSRSVMPAFRPCSRWQRKRFLLPAILQDPAAHTVPDGDTPELSIFLEQFFFDLEVAPRFCLFERRYTNDLADLGSVSIEKTFHHDALRKRGVRKNVPRTENNSKCNLRPRSL